MARPLRSLSLVGDVVALRDDSLPETLDQLALRVAGLDGTDSITLGVRELELRANGKLASRLRMPHVERLRIDLDGTQHGVEMFEGLALPQVKHLTITNGQLDKDAIVMLTRLPWTQQLTSLAITDGSLSDDNLQLLVDSHAFPSLRELDLSANELTAAALVRARALAETVIEGRQYGVGRAANVAMYRAYQWSGAPRAVGQIDEDGWQQTGRDGDVVWARYRGSALYELFVSTTDDRFGCTCPSRYQPCKHVLALRARAQSSEIPEQPSPLVELTI
jgi:hypothetical protein